MPRPPSVTQQTVHQAYQSMIEDGIDESDITAAAIQARIGGRWNRVVELLDKVRAGRGVADLPEPELEDELRQEIETYATRLVGRLRTFEQERANTAIIEAEHRVEEAEQQLEVERSRTEGLHSTLRSLEGQLADRDERLGRLEDELQAREKAHADELAELRAHHRDQVARTTTELESLRAVLMSLNANVIESSEAGRTETESHRSQILGEIAALRGYLETEAQEEPPAR